ncbi:hypothetical protein BAZSYMA_ACONTIG06588_10 [Bathymodiolus azoricus thioautotrophic gill symbiont]|uniref:Uncharacterized protein n=1 Tax=Bathymodiolus azoricus thioautotrophic gill symbiont TaxID=235205 RepID=A0A1H6KLM5_9GAMM|nr:hypothetical protein BAZSYMA_ACONTIG06588_10 [Bathymodiolus azoricus thioautotrophic gill symbiont]
MLYLVNKTTPLLVYQPLPLAQVVLLLMTSQHMIIVLVTQSLAQAMSMVTA